MALPPVPVGYDSWNQYIEDQGPVISAQQGIGAQPGKASVKLSDVSEPERQAFGTPSYREYNIFLTWNQRTVAPTEGRPWLLANAFPQSDIVTQEGFFLVTQDGFILATQ
jgi:hypothetical protein